MSKAVRAITAIALGVGSLLLITGCDNIYHLGPYELGYDGVNLVLISCEARNVETIYVEERTGGPNERRLVWEASGQMQLGAGDRLAIAGKNQGLKNSTAANVNPKPGTKYFIDMNNEPNEITSALFEIPSDGLAAGKWLDPSGSGSPQPCSTK